MFFQRGELWRLYWDTWKIFKNIWQKNEEKYFCSQKPNFWDLVKVKVTNFPNYPEMTYVINVPTYLVIMTLYLDGPLKKDIWRMAIKKSLKCSKSNSIIWTVLNCMNRILTKSHFIKISVFIQPHYTLCRGGEIRLSGYKAHLWYWLYLQSAPLTAVSSE